MRAFGRIGLLLWAVISGFGLLAALLHQEWIGAVAAAAALGVVLTAWRRFGKPAAPWFTVTATRRLALVTLAAVLVEVGFVLFAATAGIDDIMTTATGLLLPFAVAAAFYGYWWREATEHRRRTERRRQQVKSAAPGQDD